MATASGTRSTMASGVGAAVSQVRPRRIHTVRSPSAWAPPMISGCAVADHQSTVDRLGRSAAPLRTRAGQVWTRRPPPTPRPRRHGRRARSGGSSPTAGRWLRWWRWRRAIPGRAARRAPEATDGSGSTRATDLLAGSHGAGRSTGRLRPVPLAASRLRNSTRDVNPSPSAVTSQSTSAGSSPWWAAKASAQRRNGPSRSIQGVVEVEDRQRHGGILTGH